ncbi:M48 family metallopeptidase [uncultured Fibrella sp.]|uniref:M48 family metallopeptidase n=1 Tax=uncultured Fibrella sp. TaxID=1284596 RepID=UPI0035CC0E11
MRELHYGTSLIRYELIFEARKTLRIEVHPDASVWVKAPIGTDDNQLAERLARRAGWITKQQRFFSELPLPPAKKNYVSGEAFRYLGRQHRLKVAEGGPERVLRQGGRIEVWVLSCYDEARVKSRVDGWFRKQAQRLFAERLHVCLERFSGADRASLETKALLLTLRSMKGRWGSCTITGRILLNPALIQAPVLCIDYVLTHELTHLLQHNHGPEFYKLLTSAMPDWPQRKKQLETSRWD